MLLSPNCVPGTILSTLPLFNQVCSFTLHKSCGGCGGGVGAVLLLSYYR